MSSPRFLVQVFLGGSWADAYTADTRPMAEGCLRFCGGLRARILDRGEEQLALFGGTP
jgi:hypothetical protein